MSTENAASATPVHDIVSTHDVGTWYQASCSGLWYENPKACGQVQAVRVDGEVFLPMPYRLIAENGAKGALIGECYVKVEHIDCETDEEYVDEHPITWTTIKQIYDNAVRWFLHDKPRD